MEPDETETACTSIIQKLTQLSMARSECTIYKVHEHLRNINNKAYEPEVIAIGPYHRNKDNLKMMEDHKLRYFDSLFMAKPENLQKYVSGIEPLESEARKCYAEPISLNATEFIEMLVLDGCFIIELVRKFNWPHLREKSDPIFHMHWITGCLQRDLMLFENQIPFFVLCKLFDLIEKPNLHSRLVYLLSHFFHNLYPGKLSQASEIRSPLEIKHLLDLIHSNWLPSFHSADLSEGDKDERMRWKFIKNATGLREANVKFKKNIDEKVSLFEIEFKNGAMFLPPLTIECRTESFFRNLIAYEQYFLDTRAGFVMGYVKLLDRLIDSSRDVEILCRYGIIDNWLGDDEAVANMFNKLTKSFSCPGNRFIYAKIFDDVNEHCKKRRNRWMAKLRRDYLNSAWAVVSILVAVVLLLLTVTQTVASILRIV